MKYYLKPCTILWKNIFLKKIFVAIPKVEKAWVSSKWEKSGQGNIKISGSQRKVFYYLVMTFHNNVKLKFSNDLQYYKIGNCQLYVRHNNLT